LILCGVDLEIDGDVLDSKAQLTVAIEIAPLLGPARSRAAGVSSVER